MNARRRISDNRVVHGIYLAGLIAFFSCQMITQLNGMELSQRLWISGSVFVVWHLSTFVAHWVVWRKAP